MIARLSMINDLSNRVVSAGMPRMAATNAAKSAGQALQYPEFCDGLLSVNRTARVKPARRGQQRGNNFAIAREYQDQEAADHFYSRFALCASRHQSSFEFIRNRFSRKLGGAGPRDDEDVAGRRQIASATTKKFSNLPLNPVSNNRVADLAAHRNT